MHPETILQGVSADRDPGVVAAGFIPKGTITWILDPLDRIFTPEAVHEMQPLSRNFLDRYAYRNQHGELVLCWDHARFVNHSFHANSLLTPYGFELAVCDIFPGEEITNDYGFFNVQEPLYFHTDQDGSRSAVLPDDLLRYYKLWDAQLVSAFARFNIVPQTLAQWIAPAFQEKVRAVAAGQEIMDSTLGCYFDDGSRLAA